VNDLEEELASARVKDEDSSIDRLGCQVALKSLSKQIIASLPNTIV